MVWPFGPRLGRFLPKSAQSGPFLQSRPPNCSRRPGGHWLLVGSILGFGKTMCVGSKPLELGPVPGSYEEYGKWIAEVLLLLVAYLQRDLRGRGCRIIIIITLIIIHIQWIALTSTVTGGARVQAGDDQS